MPRRHLLCLAAKEAKGTQGDLFDKVQRKSQGDFLLGENATRFLWTPSKSTKGYALDPRSLIGANRNLKSNRICIQCLWKALHKT